ncbi:M61 family metallopeptidase [Dokdonella ginsengisoli]|uniref:M61 family metallopeptidase n=1 Tax=Dokdonella ginsengisoli TaxID=363846 RepID=A0ABV9QY23_9GAMM
MAQRWVWAVAIAIASGAVAGAANAQGEEVRTVPAPADAAYPGTITLNVDASDVGRRIFRVREEIPVAAGPLTLLYPQWLPGNHAPRGPIDKLAGLTIRGNGQPIAWRRDPVEVYAFHLDVPQGVGSLSVEFDFLSPQDSGQGRVVMTPDLLNLQWNTVALYPAGHYSSRITVAPSVKLPAGWQFGTALERAQGSGNAGDADGTIAFKPVPFDVLVDSPMFAGRHYKRIDLGGTPAPVHLNLFADEAKSLEFKPEQMEPHKRLVQQARKLFGSQHYDRYEFLFALTDQLGGIGLEHLRSSENTRSPGYFTEWDKWASARDLLPHEYTHSWNGKFRRPADLWTPNFNVPMQGSLLWVYEGQTQYWGTVLAARSGLLTPEQARDDLALVAASYAENRPGFGWRNLQDTTNDPIVAQRRPLPYRNYQMSEEYYSGGLMVWLAVDAKLRELSGNRRSLDDFARTFFGVDDGGMTVRTYAFDDVVAALNTVAAHDWAAFLRQRVDALAPPLDGLAAAGWKLVYTDTPSDYHKHRDTGRKAIDQSASIGLTLASNGNRITDVRWDSPAFKAGISPSGTLVAVNGREFSAERLKDAIAAAKDGKAPIELLLKNGDEYRTVRVDYRGGLRYPHLERIPGTPDRLNAILAPAK